MIEKGKFPSQPIENPKGQSTNGNSKLSNSHIEQAKSITTLRSGIIVDNKVKTFPKSLRTIPKNNLNLGIGREKNS